jgi:hypothetical protein
MEHGWNTDKCRVGRIIVFRIYPCFIGVSSVAKNLLGLRRFGLIVVRINKEIMENATQWRVVIGYQGGPDLECEFGPFFIASLHPCDPCHPW